MRYFIKVSVVRRLGFGFRSVGINMSVAVLIFKRDDGVMNIRIVWIII